MKVHARCKACLLEQSARTFDVLNLDDETRQENLKQIKEFIDERFKPDRITAEVGTEVHRELKRITNTDPYKEEKARSNAAALRLLDYAGELIENAKDPLYQSFKIAIAGNLIDFGTYDFDIDSGEKEIKKALLDEFVINDFEKIKNCIKNAKNVLYLCDNAGEIVFDTLAIEEIQKLGPVVTAAVKSGPIVNDATMEDARVAGLEGVCKQFNKVGVNIKYKDNDRRTDGWSDQNKAPDQPNGPFTSSQRYIGGVFSHITNIQFLMLKCLSR